MLLVRRKQPLGVIVALVYRSPPRTAEIVEYPRRHALYVWNIADRFRLPFVDVGLTVLGALVGYRAAQPGVGVRAEKAPRILLDFLTRISTNYNLSI